jgi:nucleoside 2-deoxyribosyltransferase
MKRIEQLYLSGPELSYPDAKDFAQERKALCLEAGFSAVTGLDGTFAETQNSEAMAREIYAERVARMRACDAGIINLTPWRGATCDTGVAFEAGFLAALGKPIFAFLNVETEDEGDYLSRIGAQVGAVLGEDDVWRDPENCAIEDFDLPENLMLWAEARRLFVIVTPDVLGDLTGLELCLEAVKLYSD